MELQSRLCHCRNIKKRNLIQNSCLESMEKEKKIYIQRKVVYAHFKVMRTILIYRALHILNTINDIYMLDQIRFYMKKFLYYSYIVYGVKYAIDIKDAILISCIANHLIIICPIIIIIKKNPLNISRFNEKRNNLNELFM